MLTDWLFHLHFIILHGIDVQSVMLNSLQDGRQILLSLIQFSTEAGTHLLLGVLIFCLYFVVV
jgi:hypothetical protein